MRLIWFHYIFSRQLVSLILIASSSLCWSQPVNSELTKLSSSASLSLSPISGDLFYSDTNHDQTSTHSSDSSYLKPSSSESGNDINSQVIYINHGNGAISSIRRSFIQPARPPFSPHVINYPSSLFDKEFSLRTAPFFGHPPNQESSNGQSNENPRLVNSNRNNNDFNVENNDYNSVDQFRSTRRPSRRSADSDDGQHSPSLSTLTAPSPTPQLSPVSPPPPSLLKPQQPQTQRSPLVEPFIPFNFENFFENDPNFDIERNVVGGSNRADQRGVNNAYAAGDRLRNSLQSSPLDNDIANRIDKPKLKIKVNNDELSNNLRTVEPRVRKQINTPSAYDRSVINGPNRPTTKPIGERGPVEPNAPFSGNRPALGNPSTGSEVGNNGFIPSYGPPGAFGLPGQEIFPFFETPFIPIGPQSDFQRRRLTTNHNNHNNNGPALANSINDNSLGYGYPPYNYYKGDDDAGTKWPKIFKFTDGRVNLSDFERNKKLGKVKFNGKEDWNFEDIKRDSFLILHGGTYNY